MHLGHNQMSLCAACAPGRVVGGDVHAQQRLPRLVCAVAFFQAGQLRGVLVNEEVGCVPHILKGRHGALAMHWLQHARTHTCASAIVFMML